MFISAAIGAAAGFAYYYYIGCVTRNVSEIQDKTMVVIRNR